MKVQLPGWKKLAIIRGKHQIALYIFARLYQGLSTAVYVPPVMKALKALVKKGLLAYYPATKQFKWHPVEPTDGGQS